MSQWNPSSCVRCSLVA